MFVAMIQTGIWFGPEISIAMENSTCTLTSRSSTTFPSASCFFRLKLGEASWSAKQDPLKRAVVEPATRGPIHVALRRRAICDCAVMQIISNTMTISRLVDVIFLISLHRTPGVNVERHTD